jgi:hypothetical protein
MQYKITHSVNFYKDKTEYVDINELLEVLSSYIKEDRKYKVKLTIKVSDINSKIMLDYLLLVGSVNGLDIKFSKKDSYVGFYLNSEMKIDFDNDKYNFLFTRYVNTFDLLKRLVMYVNKILYRRKTYIDSIYIELNQVL